MIDNNFLNHFPMGNGSISLSKLIEYVVQQSYHELTILSDTLPRKSDLERKIEICNFANCNKQRFVRLLALFRWTNNANKVDRCARISSLLHRQQMFFVDTADSLARMARESLVIARLPSFSLPCAIDVLTTGSYPRLPNSIKEKILPSDSISPLEKRQTLDRLTQIIEYRIVTSELPYNMCRPIIENGKVKFRVESEFEATLTLMSDSPTIPWRLLDIEILIEDAVVGEGKELVHPLQLQFIHELVQVKLIESDKPLHILYTCLHSFCSSLQLDILNMQANMLIQQRMGNNIKIDEYIPGKQLTIVYWSIKKAENKNEKNSFKMIIMMDIEKTNHSLKILHEPNITGSDCILVPKYIDSSYLSVEKLLGCIIRIRSLKKLKDLERELRLIIKNLCKLNSNTIQLSVPLLFPCLESEYLNISIDPMKGTFIVDSSILDSNLLTEMENCLDGDHKHLIRILNTCRCTLLLDRCKRTLNHACIPFQSQIKCKLSHPIVEANKLKIFARPSTQLDYFIAVEIVEDESNEGRLKFWLLKFRNDEGDDSIATLVHHHQLLPNVFCIGQASSIFKFKDKEFIQNSRKRKMAMHDTPNKLQYIDTFDFMMKDLLHLVAYIDDYIPFVQLSNLLNKNEIPHTGIQLDEMEHSLSITLLRMPTSEDISKEIDEMLQNNVLSISFKFQRKNEKDIWNIQIVFHQLPIITTSKFEQGQVERVHLSYEKSNFEPISKVLDSFIFDCHNISRLYQAVLHFSQLYNNNLVMQRNLEIKNYTYINLVLAYGPQKSQIAIIKSAQDQNTLQLCLGISGNGGITNYHVIVENYLNCLLNSNGSIYSLSKVLISTSNVYGILNKLQTTPIPWLKLTNIGSTTALDFSIVPQSCTHVKIIYRGIYCIDLKILENSVALWDSHFSLVDAAPHNDTNFLPIPGFLAFLTSYIENTADLNTISSLEYDTTASPSDSYDIFNKKKVDMTSSPSHIIPPSPSNLPLHVPSPSFVPAPSPAYIGVHIPSPANNFIGQVAIDGLGSPFTNSNMITPSPRNWPGSPLIAGPSPSTKIAPSPGKINSPAVKIEPGIIPKATKLGTNYPYPVMLSLSILHNICSPQSSGQVKESLLEQFLSCAYLKRVFHRQILSPNEQEHFIGLGSSEHGTIGFKAKISDLHIWIQQSPLQFQIKILPIVESSNAYDQDDLLTLQKFFELRVSCSPYKPACLTTFLLLLKLNTRILKDFISIMRAELNPDKSCRWFVQLLLTFPNGTGLEYSIGIPALALQRKITFVLNFTKNMFITDAFGNKQPDNTLTQGPNSLIIPLYYDSTGNLLQHIEYAKVQNSQPLNSITLSIITHLKKLQETITQKDCSIYLCIRDLMNSLVIKTD